MKREKCRFKSGVASRRGADDPHLILLSTKILSVVLVSVVFCPFQKNICHWLTQWITSFCSIQLWQPNQYLQGRKSRKHGSDRRYCCSFLERNESDSSPDRVCVMFMLNLMYSRYASGSSDDENKISMFDLYPIELFSVCLIFALWNDNWEMLLEVVFMLVGILDCVW